MPVAQNSLSPIHETSTTASLSDTEEASYDNYELDDLFNELKKTSKSKATNTLDTSKDLDSEFSKIKKSIARLPKIKTSEDELVEFDKSKPPSLASVSVSLMKKSIQNINDPISITKKKDDKEPTTSGSKWFDMPKGELTESVQRDLRIIQQRAALDPKRHYKKEKWQTPKFFQVGTIVESSAEFYSSRLKNKDRHNTILESVLNDNDTKHYFKRKYDEIQVKKTSGKKAHYKKVKEARRKF